jgi:hypothetical protein
LAARPTLKGFRGPSGWHFAVEAPDGSRYAPPPWAFDLPQGDTLEDR